MYRFAIKASVTEDAPVEMVAQEPAKAKQPPDVKAILDAVAKTNVKPVS